MGGMCGGGETLPPTGFALSRVRPTAAKVKSPTLSRKKRQDKDGAPASPAGRQHYFTPFSGFHEPCRRRI